MCCFRRIKQPFISLSMLQFSCLSHNYTNFSNVKVETRFTHICIDVAFCHRCHIKLHVCVRHNGELSKMTEPIKMPYRRQTGAGSRNHVLDGSAHLHHLVNTTERSMHSGNATSCQITLITWYITIIILRPLYRSTCVSWHLQLRTGGFAGAKFYCSHAPADDQSAFAQ